MEENILKLNLHNFMAVSRFRSVNRAFKRGHISFYGVIYPKRPFNNRTSKNNSRPFNEIKKHIYEQFRRRQEE